jgi:NitT/TauT family transport system permease protein
MTVDAAPTHERRQATDGTATRASRTPRRGVPNIVYTIVIAVALLVFAEVAAANEWVSRLILPAPTAVWSALVAGFESGLYWEHMYSTVRSTLGGFLLAAVSAITIAGLLASIERLEKIFLPFIVAFQTVPKIAIAPLIILWLGFGDQAKIVIITVICFFPILVNALQGLKLRDRAQLELMQSLGASRWQMFRYIRVPNSLPYVFAGFHVAIIFSLIGAVVAEFVGSRAGLGYILIQAQGQFNVPGVFAILLILMVIGVTFHRTMVFIERRVAFWAKDVSVVGA